MNVIVMVNPRQIVLTDLTTSPRILLSVLLSAMLRPLVDVVVVVVFIEGRLLYTHYFGENATYILKKKNSTIRLYTHPLLAVKKIKLYFIGAKLHGEKLSPLLAEKKSLGLLAR